MSTLTLKEAHEKIAKIGRNIDGHALVILVERKGIDAHTLVDMALPGDECERQAEMLVMLEDAVKTICAEMIACGMPFEAASAMIKLSVLFALSKVDVEKVAENRHED